MLLRWGEALAAAAAAAAGLKELVMMGAMEGRAGRGVRRRRRSAERQDEQIMFENVDCLLKLLLLEMADSR